MKITIFGLAGSGTSTIGKLLAVELGHTFTSTGNIFRKFAADAGLDLYTFETSVAKHDINFDKKLDRESAKYGQENEDFVFESRLAWHFIPDSFKIYLDCEQEERYRRIHEREKGDIKDIRTFNSRREKELEERYSLAYPNICFPPKKEDFDLYIDSTNLSPHAIIEIIKKSLSSSGSSTL